MSCVICGEPLTETDAFTPVRLLRCAACGLHVSTTDPASAVASYADDDGYLATHADVQWDEVQRRHEARVRLSWLGEADEVFEAGAAQGWFLDEARRMGIRGRGVEPSPSLAAHARDELGLDVQTAYAENVETRPTADAACLWHVLEHVPDPVAFLNDCARQVRPGGRVFVEVPNIESGMARARGAGWSGLQPEVHLMHFGPRALHVALERAGLAVLDVRAVSTSTYVRPTERRRPRRLASTARWAVTARGPGEFLRAVASTAQPQS